MLTFYRSCHLCHSCHMPFLSSAIPGITFLPSTIIPAVYKADCGSTHSILIDTVTTHADPAIPVIPAIYLSTHLILTHTDHHPYQSCHLSICHPCNLESLTPHPTDASSHR
jgi:hypothetical protein